MDENTKPEVEGGFEQATLAAWRGDLGLMDLLERPIALAGPGQNPLAAVLYRTAAAQPHAAQPPDLVQPGRAVVLARTISLVRASLQPR
jgi:hypothetical protein